MSRAKKKNRIGDEVKDAEIKERDGNGDADGDADGEKDTNDTDTTAADTLDVQRCVINWLVSNMKDLHLADFCGSRTQGLRWCFRLLVNDGEAFEVVIQPYVRGSEGVLYVACDRAFPREEVKLKSQLHEVPFPRAVDFGSCDDAVRKYCEVLLVILPDIRKDAARHLAFMRRCGRGIMGVSGINGLSAIHEEDIKETEIGQILESENTNKTSYSHSYLTPIQPLNSIFSNYSNANVGTTSQPLPERRRNGNRNRNSNRHRNNRDPDPFPAWFSMFV